MLGFFPLVLFWVLLHLTQIQSLHFVSISQASRPDSIPSFCFGFACVAPGFDTFVFLQFLRHRTRIRSLSLVSGALVLLLDYIPSFFILGSPASRPDSIPYFLFRFSGIALRFDPFLFYFMFSGIALRFDPFLLYRVLWHCAKI